MSLIRDSLKKVQENGDSQDKTTAALITTPSGGSVKKGTPALYAVIGIGVLLIGLVYYFLYQKPAPKAPAQPPLSAKALAPVPAQAGPSPASDSGRPKTLATLPPTPAKQPAAKAEGETLPARAKGEVKTGAAGEPGTRAETKIETTAAREKSSGRSIPAGKPSVPSGAEGDSGLQPQDRTARENLKKAYDQAYGRQLEGKFEAARKGYLDILNQDPHNPYVLTNLGILSQNMARTREAISYFEKALEADPRFVPAAQNLGLSWLKLGNDEEAARWLEKSLSLQPDNAAAQANLGILYKKRGNRELARQYLKQSLASDPGVPEVSYNLARLEEESGNFPEAYRFYQQYISLRNNPKDPLVIEVQRHIREWK